MSNVGFLAASVQTSGPNGSAIDELSTAGSLRGLYMVLVVLLVIRVLLLVLAVWATIDLVRRPDAVLKSAGVARGRWFMWFTVVPFAELYYLAVKRPVLDAAAVRIDHREVVYDLSTWSATSRHDLLRLLDRRKIQHQVEGDDLVVAKVSERRVDQWVAQLGPAT